MAGSGTPPPSGLLQPQGLDAPAGTSLHPAGPGVRESQNFHLCPKGLMVRFRWQRGCEIAAARAGSALPGAPRPGARRQVSAGSPGPVPTCSPMQVNVYYSSLNRLTSANGISHCGPAGILMRVVKPAVEAGLLRGGMCLPAAI